jgi:hypothetical protein
VVGGRVWLRHSSQQRARRAAAFTRAIRRCLRRRSRAFVLFLLAGVVVLFVRLWRRARAASWSDEVGLREHRGFLKRCYIIMPCRDSLLEARVVQRATLRPVFWSFLDGQAGGRRTVLEKNPLKVLVVRPPDLDLTLFPNWKLIVSRELHLSCSLFCNLCRNLLQLSFFWSSIALFHVSESFKLATR